MTGWRTIDEAPKDGTVVLVWTREGYHLAGYVEGPPGRWIEQHGSYVLAEETTGLPSHWMPLTPPSGAIGAGPER